MRILMLSHGYPPTVSGVTLVTQKVARSMARRGHTVTVVTASERGIAYRNEDRGVQLVRVGSRPNPFWTEGPIPFISHKILREVLVDARPDVIHSHENALLCLQLLRAAQDFDIPLVATCHFLPRFVIQYLEWDGKLEAFAEAIVWEFAIKLLNQFDRVIFPSQTQQAAFVEHGLSSPTTIISNGVNMARYRPDGGGVEGVVSRYHLPPGPRILFVGRLAKDKDIEVLVRAMSRASAESHAHLLLVGGGDDRPRLEELTRDLGVSHRVHFLGFVPEVDLPALYRACDLFAIASICEVQSIPTLQAVATGLPVVAADAAALPELVHHEVNGLLVPPGDFEAMGRAFVKIVNAPDRARFGEASLDISLSHAETRTFEAHEELYYSLLRPEAHEREDAGYARYGSRSSVR